MPDAKVPSEKVSVEKAIQRTHDLCVSNTERMIKLEEQYNQMWKSIAQKHEEMETQIVNIQSQTNDMRIKATLNLEEDKKKFDEIKQQCNEIMKTLCSLTSIEKLESPNINEVRKTTDVCLTLTQPALTDHVQTPKSHTIMIPSPTTTPTYSGKYSESPNQFLIRIQEFTETVYGWDRRTLLLGISQFLRDIALDWYCQLRASHRSPQVWAEFVSLFLSQFNSPIRIARQEQDWYECKQLKNETINEFLIRLRSMWSEQRPKETEVDLVKHFLCKMRSDLFTMMRVCPGASLDEIVLEGQKVEEILYRRNEEQCLAEYFKQVSFANNTSDKYQYSNDNRVSEDHFQALTSKSYSKNGHGALGRRDVDARQ